MNKISKRLNNERGVIFVTVLMIIIMMMAITATMISLNVSSIQGTESEYRHIQAQELTKGMIYYHAANQQTAGASDNYTLSHTIDNVTYDTAVQMNPSGTGIYGTNTLTITTDY